MRRGELSQVLEPAYIDPDEATALAGPGASGYLYAVVNVEDSDDGRIVAFDTKARMPCSCDCQSGLPPAMWMSGCRSTACRT